jgi:hypothetical protein
MVATHAPCRVTLNKPGKYLKRTRVVVTQGAYVRGVSTCPVGGNQSTIRYTVEQGVPEGPPTYLDARQCGEDAAA